MRRWTLQVLSWLVLGAVVNVAVAWWCARHEQPEIDGRLASIRAQIAEAKAANRPVAQFFNGKEQTLYRWRLVDPSPKAWPIPVPQCWPERPDEVGVDRGLGWTEIVGRNDSNDFPYYSTICREYGMPFRSLWAWGQMAVFPETSEADPQPQSVVLPVPRALRWAVPSIPFLPVVPLWPGFVMDSLVYAILGAVVWCGICGGFSKWRGRRGRCVACRYDLAGMAPGSTCPEFGKASSIISPAPEQS